MDNLIPNSFVEALAGSLVLAAIVVGAISLMPSLRAHSLRLMALLFVGSLSLFSNHWSTYFASIFVIATAVTELEFLQNLAAIIRGNKEYFDFKKETLTHTQREEKVAREQEEISKASENRKQGDVKAAHTKSAPEITFQRAPEIGKILQYESKALERVEKYLGNSIERNVLVKGSDGRQIELDGLIPSVVDDMVPEKIIEVKFIKSPNDLARILKLFPRIENMGRTYRSITKKIANIHFVLIIDGKETLSNDQFERLKQEVDTNSMTTGYSVFTTAQLDEE